MNQAAAMPRRSMQLAVAGAALLAVLAAVLFYYASVWMRHRSPATAELTVTIAGKTCEPNELTVPAGRRTFRILNQSDRAVEWEIIDGVMVLAERENIAPGIAQTLTAKLTAGTYQITCGLLSNPRGTLHVTDSAEAAAEAARPPMTAFIGPLSEYQLILALGADSLVEATKSLADAITAGDLDRARQLYLPAREAYARIEIAASRFADLATSIDAEADYFERREQDPAFKGFHRIEYELFGTGGSSDLAPLAQSLLTDVTALQARISELQPAPEQPTSAAAALLAGRAQARVQQGGDRYAHVDLPVLAANIDASWKVVELFRPLVAKAKPELMQELDRQHAALAATMAGFHRPDGDVAYDQVDEAARAKLAQQLQALADGVAQIDAVLGLE